MPRACHADFSPGYSRSIAIRVLPTIGSAHRLPQERPMFVEQRLYTFAPGKSAEFNRLYEDEGRAPQERHLGRPVGYYYSEIGPLNQVMTLWAYATLDERVARRERLFNDPQWISFLHKARALVVTQETRILKPAPFFDERLKAIVALDQETGRQDTRSQDTRFQETRS
jgi:hypothetical protein